jgi:hypothetical protein
MITSLDCVEVVIMSSVIKRRLKGESKLEIQDARYLLHLEIVSEITYTLSKITNVLFVE